MALRFSFIAFALIALSCSTSPPQHVLSRLKGLAANEGARNIAVIGSGAGPGVSSSNAFELDIRKMADVLSAAPFNYEVRMKGDAYPEELAKEIAKAAKDLGPDGTLLFFFSGHGSKGKLFKGESSLSSSELNAAVANGNYARFTAIIEACESGSFAHGSQAITIQENFKSLLVMTAAKADENSADNGTDSFFPNYLEKYLKELAQTPTATVKDLTDKVFEAARKANPSQTGDMSAIPVSILDEPVFNAGNNSQTGSIFIALGASTSTADPQIIYASLQGEPNSVVKLCGGDGAACRAVPANDSRLLRMDLATKTAERLIYKSSRGVRLDQQSVLTVLVYQNATSETPTQSKTIRFKSKSMAQN